MAVLADDPRIVPSPQPARADRQPPARASLNGRSGLAAWLSRIHGSVDRKRPRHFENAERCVAAESPVSQELADVLEGDPLSVGGRIDIRTGEVWSQAAIDYVLETGEEGEDTSDDPERWLAVHGGGSREGYRDMGLFIVSVEDPGRAERLAVAIRGRGVFRRFKDELACWPGELERWHALCEERQRGRARSWLAAAGYRVLAVEYRDS